MNLKEATARRPLWSVTHANLSLDYPLIRLVDEDVDDFHAMEAGEQLDEENWAIAGEGWLCLLSTGTGHTPVITMEAWEEAPASSGPGTSDCEQELVATFPSGTLWLSGGTDGGTVGQPMVVPESDAQRYRIRVQMRNAVFGKTAAELYSEYLDGNPDGGDHLYVEFWRLQFWPAE